MPQPAHLDPGPFTAPVAQSAGLRTGALLIHGFTGSVAETRPMGEYLAARGLAVRCPLLPGHGTTPLALTRIRWRAWTDHVEGVLADLQKGCDALFVGGLSLGSLLALWLGARHPDLAGLILMAPAVKIQNRLLPLSLGLRYLFKYNPLGPMGDQDLGEPGATDRIWCYDKTPMWGAAEVYLLQRRVRAALGKVRAPVLVFQGRRDAQLAPQAAQMVYDGVSSTDKTLVWLDRSGHNVLADGEREVVWSRSYAWLAEKAEGKREKA
jgi:carboxylesterase